MSEEYVAYARLYIYHTAGCMPWLLAGLWVDTFFVAFSLRLGPSSMTNAHWLQESRVVFATHTNGSLLAYAARAVWELIV